MLSYTQERQYIIVQTGFVHGKAWSLSTKTAINNRDGLSSLPINHSVHAPNGQRERERERFTHVKKLGETDEGRKNREAQRQRETER